MFYVIEFTYENEVAIIPDNWLIRINCAVWPSFRNPGKLMKAVSENYIPEEHWKAYPIRILYTCDSLKKAQLMESEINSDLQSQTEKEDEGESSQRRSKRLKRPRTFSSDEEDEFEGNSLTSRTSRRGADWMASLPQSPTLPPVSTVLSATRQPQAAPTTSRDDVRDEMIFRILEEVKQEQNRLGNVLEEVLSTLRQLNGVKPDPEAPPLPESFSFPVQCLESLEILETRLEEKAFSDSIINSLSLLGGKSVTDAIRRVMRHIISSQFAMEFNWYGKKGKLPFGKLKMAAIIQKAVHKHFPGTTCAEVEVTVRGWLRTASDRDGGRKRRSLVQNPVEQA